MVMLNIYQHRMYPQTCQKEEKEHIYILLLMLKSAPRQDTQGAQRSCGCGQTWHQKTCQHVLLASIHDKAWNYSIKKQPYTTLYLYQGLYLKYGELVAGTLHLAAG